MNKKGFTLIESMVAVSVSALIAIGGTTYLLSKAKDSKIDAISSKMVKIVSAVDQRVYIDKYDIGLWPPTTSYVTTTQVNKFLTREFIAKTASCGDPINGWVPEIKDPSDANEVAYKEGLKLVPCDVWGGTATEFGMTATARFDGTATEIRNVNFFFRFDKDEDFEENFLNLKKILKKTKELDGKNITGSHNYLFVDMSKAKPEEHSFTALECLAAKSNCGFLAQYSADGGGVEYLDVTGANSMINSKIDFVEIEGGDVINDCMTFEFDAGTGSWNAVNAIDCGIGIDPTKSAPFVEADVYALSAEKIFLNKTCTMSFGGVINQVPCGIFNDASTAGGGNAPHAIAVLDELQAEEAFVNMLNVDEITTNTLNVDGTMTVDGTTEINELTVNAKADFNEDVHMKGTGNKVDHDLRIFGETEVDVLTVNSAALFKKNLQVDGFLDVRNGFITADHLELDTITVGELNRNCSTLNALKLFKDGEHTEPVICTTFTDIDGKTKTAWKLANARIGQIVPFDGTCPKGFDYFEEASGRFLMGENESLLKGKSAAQQAALVSQGKAFRNKDGNIVTIKAGEQGGEAFHQLTEDELPRHNHKVPDIKASCVGTDCAGYAMATVGNKGSTVWSNANEIPTGSAGGGKKHENRPPYYVVNYCIYSGK